MSELFLVAHKVRGEPAFDIATRIACAECRAYEYVDNITVAESNMGCPECDGLGYWWIIPTSGHRAYPCWELSFNVINMAVGPERAPKLEDFANLPDHYPTRSTPSTPTPSLADRLGITRRPTQSIPRRI